MRGSYDQADTKILSVESFGEDGSSLMMDRISGLGSDVEVERELEEGRRIRVSCD